MPTRTDEQNDASGSSKRKGGGEKKLRPCCACPETRKARDECILANGEEECQSFIEAHKECLRKEGFKV